MCVYRVDTFCTTGSRLSVGGQRAKRKEAQKNKKCKEVEVMFWAGLFIVIALFIGLLFGYGWGYDAGKKDGIRAKKERHIDAKV